LSLLTLRLINKICFCPQSYSGVDESFIKQEKPDFIVILPWNIREEFALAQYIRDWNGHLFTLRNSKHFWPKIRDKKKQNIKTVLLTGATGFIGQFAIRQLARQNYIVHCNLRAIVLKQAKIFFWHQTGYIAWQEFEVKKNSPDSSLHVVCWTKVRFGVRLKIWLIYKLVCIWLTIRWDGGERLVISGKLCQEYDWTEEGIFRKKITGCIHHLYGTNTP